MDDRPNQSSEKTPPKYFPGDDPESPADRKFGRISDYAAPLNPVEIIGIVIGGIIVVILLNVGAVIFGVAYITKQIAQAVVALARKLIARLGGKPAPRSPVDQYRDIDRQS